VPRRGRPQSVDGGATAAVAGRKVAGYTGCGAAAGSAAPTRPRDMVSRVCVINWYKIGSKIVIRQIILKHMSNISGSKVAQVFLDTGTAGCVSAAEVLPWW